MTAYMVAFSRSLQAQLDPGGYGFVAPLHPTASLFLHQGAREVAGVTGDNLEAVTERLRSSSMLPWLITLDRRHFACVQGHQWDVRVMAAWFRGVAERALAELRGRDNVREACAGS
jgi:hypothetical protein